MSRLTLIIIAFVVSMLLICMGIILPFDLALNLAFGWAPFLYRVIPQLTLNVGSVLAATAAVVAFALGLHGFLTWLVPRLAEAGSNSQWRWRKRWTAAVVGGVVILFASGVATVGVVHQLGWLLASKDRLLTFGGSPAVSRVRSVNNLKQIGLAFYNYNQSIGTFPPGSTFDRTGRPLHSWQSLLLPFMEETALAEQIDFLSPWDEPVNARAFQTPLRGLLNPEFGSPEEKDAAGYALTHYTANVRVLGNDKALRIEDFKDGTSQTLMAGEVAEGFKPWGDPMNRRDPGLGINQSPEGFGSPQKTGALFLLSDGSVRFIRTGVKPSHLKALSTPASGEVIRPEDEF
ncbi:DUF1559 domain-containing protein [Singulisphaera sp. PoT]|uniref:DUF1559 family PulG-like putative transporter n=1 Tax=Singulisphaera sp. PoT TaxID=3411797 RepID=UPI003BF58E46